MQKIGILCIGGTLRTGAVSNVRAHTCGTYTLNCTTSGNGTTHKRTRPSCSHSLSRHLSWSEATMYLICNICIYEWNAYYLSLALRDRASVFSSYFRLPQCCARLKCIDRCCSRYDVEYINSNKRLVTLVSGGTYALCVVERPSWKTETNGVTAFASFRLMMMLWCWGCSTYTTSARTSQLCLIWPQWLRSGWRSIDRNTCSVYILSIYSERSVRESRRNELQPFEWFLMTSHKKSSRSSSQLLYF